jgi:hypothetical protein
LARSIFTERAAGPFADDEVELEILHRRIEHLLDRRIEPVDLVDEENVALLQIGEQRREIAGLGDHRPRGGAEVDTKLARNDLRQGGLAEARRPDEQHVIERLVPRPRSLDEHREIGARLLLADELGQPLRPERSLGEVLFTAFGGNEAAGRGAHGSSPSFAAVLVRNELADLDRLRAAAPRHDDARIAIVVPDQLAASAAGRHHRDGAVLFLGRRMPHRDDHLDAGFA